MHLVQLLLPLRDPDRRSFAGSHFTRVRGELTERFGGVTAFIHSPAQGVWEDGEGEVEVDQIVVYEVMVERLDRDWWRRYREELRQRFRQEELVVRAVEMERL